MASGRRPNFVVIMTGVSGRGVHILGNPQSLLMLSSERQYSYCLDSPIPPHLPLSSSAQQVLRSLAASVCLHR
jgi:hypothetical protein